MSDTPFLAEPRPSTERYDTHIPNPLAAENAFRRRQPDQQYLPVFETSRGQLPAPFWEGHQGAMDCYWRAWQLAFSNLHLPQPDSGFVSAYCDTAFNGNLFMWDSAFITFFGIYARRVFPFQGTLDNFYCKQHEDGFICREITQVEGQDAFHRFDPSSTGPNILAWAEWNHYQHSGDRDRLQQVFPVLLAFHQWFKTYRSWPDGTYYSSGWGTGMDNMPRLDDQDHKWWSHGHMSWVDTTLQVILNARVLLNIAAVITQDDAVSDLKEEIERLTRLVNDTMWDDGKAYYFDRFADGRLSSVKHIGAYWALLAEVVPRQNLDAFIAHLENHAEFNRPHRIPALSADDPHYSPRANYWSGGVWPPTNYMVLKGLQRRGFSELAHRIALNHLDNVVKVYESDTRWEGAEQFLKFFRMKSLPVDETHTLWEDYESETAAPGLPSRPGYVGWSALPPIAVLFEDIFGLQPMVPAGKLVWNVRLLEEHGVEHYPFGQNGDMKIHCAHRASAREKPVVEISSNIPLTVELNWESGHDAIHIS